MHNLLHMNDPIINPIHNDNTTTPDESSSSYDIHLILRLLFYLIFAIKIIDISFNRKKKFSLKERIYRKLIFSYQEIMRYFTEEERSMMETTLNNTMKNATIEYDPNNSKIRKTFKKVSIDINRNKYYGPKIWKQQQSTLNTIKQQPLIDIQQQDTFQDQKIHDQFAERSNLLDMIDKQDQMLPFNSNLIAKDQEIYQPGVNYNGQSKKESNSSNPSSTHEQL